MTSLKARNSRRKKTKSGEVKTPPLSPKEKLAIKREAKKARQKLIVSWSASIALGLLTAIVLLLLFELKFAVAGGLGVAAMILSYTYPRASLWVFLIYMPFSGTVTYWFAEGNIIFQIAKDIFYFPALLALMVDCRRRNKPIFVAKQLIPTLSFLFFICLIVFLLVNVRMELFAPTCEYTREVGIGGVCRNGQPILQGLLGLKVFLGYIPLAFCAYYLIEDKKTLLNLGRVLVVLAIICCTLAFIQYMFLRTGRCQATSEITEGAGLFRASLENKCFVGGSLLYTPEQGQIRLPGTFVSPWHWGWFLIANSAICFTVAFFETSLFWRLVGFSGMGLILINSVVSGQRAALIAAPAFILVMLVLTGQIVKLKRFIPIAVGMAIVGFVFVTLNPEIVQERIDSVIGRWQASPPQDFIIGQWRWATRSRSSYGGPLFGSGLGAATNSARAFGSTAFLETYHPKVVYEVGYLGLMAFMVFITHLLIYTFKQYQSLTDPVLKSFGSAFWVFLLVIGYMPYWYPLDADPVAIYYWLFAGVLMKLTIIDKEEKSKEIQEITSKNRRYRLNKNKKFVPLKKRLKT